MLRGAAAAIAVLAVLFLWGRALGSGVIDDALIFARYAENIAGGHGPR